MTQTSPSTPGGALPQQSDRAVTRICFALYHVDVDNSFKRAAETWIAEKGNCRTEVLVVISPKHLVKLFEDLSSRAKAMDAKISGGALFLHASPPDSQDTRTDGLQIAPYDPHRLQTLAELRVREALRQQYRSGRVSPFAVNPSIIEELPQLPWAPGATLEVVGCNSGVGTPSLAQSFARNQGVRTTGQRGFASFSKSKDKYEAIDKTTRTVYLRAYYDRRNYASGVLDLDLPRLVGVPSRAIPEVVITPVR